MQATLFGNSIQEQFWVFHHDNPQVYVHLVRLAREWKQAGNRKLGIATLFEKLRWDYHLSGIKDDAGYKLNNNYRAMYARLIMEQEHDLKGIFEIRQLKSGAE